MKRTQPIRGVIRAVMFVLAVVAALNTAVAQQREPQLDPEGELERLERAHRESLKDEAAQRTGEDPRGRAEWFNFQRRFPYDIIPADLRPNAIREMNRQTALLERALGGKRWNAGVLAANKWEEVGPFNYAGRTRGLAIKPGDGQTIYIGAAAGGVWKTSNGGQSWQTTTDTLSSLAACALAIDRSNPNVIYMGTGENSVNTDRYDGDGLFKSTDGGLTWKNIGLRNVGAFSKLYVHRQNAQIVYAAAARGSAGFYRSEDGGATWKSIIPGDVWDIAVNPLNCNELFIAQTGTIRRSTDAGKTFTQVTTGLTLTRSIRISIAMSPAQTTRLYALVGRDPGNGGNHIGEAYVSTNSGESWTLKKTFDQFFFNKQAWYDNCAAADPFDPDVALVAGIDVHRTTDGGNTWTNTTRSYTGGNVHPDQHVLEFDETAPGFVVLGNDGGVYASFDAGGTWQEISAQLPTSQYYAMDVDQTKPYRIYGGTQDNGSHGHYGTNAWQKDWQRVLAGDGFYVVVDLSDPNVIYAEQFNGTPLYRIDATNTNSRTRIDASISSDSETGDPGIWSTPIVMGAADKKSLFTGRSQLYRSTNRGGRWDVLYPTTGRSIKITAIGPSPADTNNILIARSNGEVLHTLDAGKTWTKSAGLPSRQCTDIIFDENAPNRVYVTFSGSGGGHIYRSDDRGVNFRNITNGLPDISTNALAIDPRDTSRLFVGTDIGVFMSFNGGANWVPFNNGLALSPVVDLKIHKTSHTLFAATHGRSMFRVSISGLEPPPILLTPTGGMTIATPGTVAVRWSGLTGPVRIYISLDGGKTWRLVGEGVVGDSDSIDVGLLRSSMVRVRVVETGGSGRSVESGDFSLTAASNCQDLGKKGFIAEAIEYRRGSIWSTVRGSDSLYRLRVPLLGGRTGLVRSNIPGTVRDMAYSDARDLFYMLVTANDFSSPKLYTMDSNGVGTGEITLPTEILRANGITKVDDGLALVSPGATTEVFIIDESTGALLRRSGPLAGQPGPDRRSLAYDLLGYVQGVVNSDTIGFPSQLQHMVADPELRVREANTVIPPNSTRFDFFGLAFDPSNADVNKRLYWATDTAGAFCKCEREKFFTTGVESGEAFTGFAVRTLALGAIAPNPVRDEAAITLVVRARDHYRVEIFDVAGASLGVPFTGPLEPGTHTVRYSSASLPSGLYYVALTSQNGERDTRPMVVVR